MAQPYVLADARHPRVSASGDFERRLAAAQNTATIAARQRRSAVATISATCADVATADRLIAATSTLTFAAEPQTAGNIDPTPADSMASAELQLLDSKDL
ncbi:MAG: hypothetical protein ABI629_11310 [bacterium]